MAQESVVCPNEGYPHVKNQSIVYSGRASHNHPAEGNDKRSAQRDIQHNLLLPCYTQHVGRQISEKTVTDPPTLKMSFSPPELDAEDVG